MAESYICMTQLHCSPETITTSLTVYTPIKTKTFLFLMLTSALKKKKRNTHTFPPFQICEATVSIHQQTLRFLQQSFFPLDSALGQPFLPDCRAPSSAPTLQGWYRPGLTTSRAQRNHHFSGSLPEKEVSFPSCLQIDNIPPPHQTPHSGLSQRRSDARHPISLYPHFPSQWDLSLSH